MIRGPRDRRRRRSDIASRRAAITGSSGALTTRHLGRGDVMARLLIVLAVAVGLAADVGAQPKAPPVKPDREIRWALYVTLAPSWFDPGELTAGFITPFRVLSAMHDALFNALPGNLMATPCSRQCRAISWRPASPSRGRRARTARGTSSNCTKASCSTTAIRSPRRT